MTFAEQPHYIQQIKNIQVTQVDKPRSWKIVASEEVESGHDEVVLSFQGVVVQKSLPPVINRMYVGLLSGHWHLKTDKRTRIPSKKQFTRQSVQLTGLSTPSFQTCVDKLQDIHSTFKRYVPDGAMEPFEPSEFLNHPCIDISTRYFTSRRKDPTGTAVPFSHAVDPKGILQALCTDEHFHGPDNEVLYYMLTSTSTDKKHR